MLQSRALWTRAVSTNIVRLHVSSHAARLQPARSYVVDPATSSQDSFASLDIISLDDAALEGTVGTTTPEEEVGSTSVQALMNSVSILMGVGILSIPYALNQGGWSALGVLALIGLATNHTGKLLVKCQEYYNVKPSATLVPGSSIAVRSGVIQTYEDIAEVAFGKQGRDFMTVVLYTELIGTCALFLILEKDHAQIIMDSVPQLAAAGAGLSDTTLMFAAAALFIPTTWLSDLSALAYISFAGLLSSVGLTGLVVYSYFAGGPHSVETAAVHLQSLPVTFGLIAFVFAGHAVFPIIYAGMKPSEQPKFPAVLDLTYLIIGAATLAIGCAGYLSYGSDALEEVTMNLPVGPLQILGTALILIAPFSKFALTLEPVAAGADSALGIEKGTLPARAVRTGLGMFALMLATRVPFFGTFMSLLGSFLTLMVSVMFPAAAFLKMYWDDLSDQEKFTNYAVIFIGGVCTITGTATSLDAAMHSGSIHAIEAAAMHPVMPASTAGDVVRSTVMNGHVLNKLVCNSLCEMRGL